MSTDTLDVSTVDNTQYPCVAMDDLCEKYPGIRSPAATPEVPFTYVDITAVDNISKRITESRTLLGKEAPSRARNVIRSGDVIVATTRPNLNAVALVPEELDSQICSTGFCVLRPGPMLLSEYLFLFVQSGGFVDPLADLVKGALYPAVTDYQVRSQRIPLVPFSEQKRIAAGLSAALATVETARRAAEERLAAAEALTTAYLHQVFEATHSEEMRESVALGDVCRMDSPLVDPKLPEYRDLPHVNGENIESGTGHLLAVQSAAEDGMESGKYLYESGVVLYSKLRPYLRKTARANFRGLCSADMYPLHCDEKRLAPDFLLFLLLSKEFTGYAVEASARARMPKLNREQLFAFEFDLPDLAVQQRIAADLSEKLAATQKLMTRLREELVVVESLPAALLRRAFNYN